MASVYLEVGYGTCVKIIADVVICDSVIDGCRVGVVHLYGVADCCAGDAFWVGGIANWIIDDTGGFGECRVGAGAIGAIPVFTAVLIAISCLYL